MKSLVAKRWIALLVVLAIHMGCTAGTIMLEGRYQQRNIFVINAASPDGIGYCIYEVLVNGLVTSDEINSQAFEIDLTIYGLKNGDPVNILIKHKDGCTPKILNQGALEPSPTFVCTSITCGINGALTWETTGEMGKIPFIVQQYKWNRWVIIGEVLGNGTNVKNVYRFQTPLTSGLNKFRVVQKSFEGDLRKSPVCEVTSTVELVTYRYDKKSKSVYFSYETTYELFNVFGQVVKRGRGTSIDCSALGKGEYWVSFDNQTEKFTKK
jgi:hypothetical protein